MTVCHGHAEKVSSRELRLWEVPWLEHLPSATRSESSRLRVMAEDESPQGWHCCRPSTRGLPPPSCVVTAGAGLCQHRAPQAQVPSLSSAESHVCLLQPYSCSWGHPCRHGAWGVNGNLPSPQATELTGASHWCASSNGYTEKGTSTVTSPDSGPQPASSISWYPGNREELQ
jgi:hypothetical protein